MFGWQGRFETCPYGLVGWRGLGVAVVGMWLIGWQGRFETCPYGLVGWRGLGVAVVGVARGPGNL